MKLKQKVVLTTEEVVSILKKVVENKTKKKVQDQVVPTMQAGDWEFQLEDGVVEEQK
jgi:hypothetical protein